MTVACGPYFDAVGIGTSVFLLVVVKPLTYWFFVMAFRYRVSTPVPLSRSAAAKIAALRAGLGFVLLLLAFGAMRLFPESGLGGEVPAWWMLGLERAVAWTAFGWFAVKLRGRRLLGWVISGLGIDLAFDVATLALALGVGNPVLTVGLLAVALAGFLAPLSIVGRRPSLKARFLANNLCRQCGYELTGNTSGICPECGRSIVAA